MTDHEARVIEPGEDLGIIKRPNGEPICRFNLGVIVGFGDSQIENPVKPVDTYIASDPESKEPRLVVQLERTPTHQAHATIDIMPLDDGAARNLALLQATAKMALWNSTIRQADLNLSSSGLPVETLEQIGFAHDMNHAGVMHLQGHELSASAA